METGFSENKLIRSLYLEELLTSGGGEDSADFFSSLGLQFKNKIDKMTDWSKDEFLPNPTFDKLALKLDWTP